MQSVDYSKPFSSFEIIIKIVNTTIEGKYSPKGLVESVSKLVNVGVDCVANTVSLLQQAEILIINQDGFFQAENSSVDLIKNSIFTHLKKVNLLDKLASAVEVNPNSKVNTLNQFKLFPKFRGLTQLATSLDLLTYNTSLNCYEISKEGNKLLSAIIYENSFNVYDDGITPSQLADRIESQAARGNRAEEYVLELERLRLKDHPHVGAIKRVSLTNTSAGFDIQSFDSISSTTIDKFIEVKSFAGQPGFYWSINEINFARDKGAAYCLVTVNFNKIDEDDYEPPEIRNPYMIFNMQEHMPNQKLTGIFDIQPTNFYISLKK